MLLQGSGMGSFDILRHDVDGRAEMMGVAKSFNNR
jgi:hypothetical protein